MCDVFSWSRFPLPELRDATNIHPSSSWSGRALFKDSGPQAQVPSFASQSVVSSADNHFFFVWVFLLFSRKPHPDSIGELQPLPFHSRPEAIWW